MRVFYITKYSDLPSETETGSRGFHLCKYWSEQSVQVTMLTSSSIYLHPANPYVRVNKKKEIYFGNLKVVIVPTVRFIKGSVILRLLSWIQFEFGCIRYLLLSIKGGDILVCSSLSLLSVCTGLMMKSIYKLRVVFEVRDIWPLTLITDAGYNRSNFFIFLLSSIEYAGYKYSDLIVGTMQNLREHVNNVCQTKTPVACIPMGVSKLHLSLYDNDKREGDYGMQQNIYRQLRVEKSTKLIFYAGSFGLHNSLDNIFKAASSLREIDCKIKFVFVGDGALYNQYVEKYGTYKNVLFMPKVTRYELVVLLKYANLLIYSTTSSDVWRYGQSLNKMIDYIMAKKPILGIYDGYIGDMEKLPSIYTIAPDKAAMPGGLANKVIEILAMPDIVHKHTCDFSYKWLLRNRLYEILGSEYLSLLNSLD